MSPFHFFNEPILFVFSNGFETILIFQLTVEIAMILGKTKIVTNLLAIPSNFTL
jgi:hypothetical protein